MRNIAVFVSGGGTNMENIIRYFSKSQKARVSLVISNKPDAFALTRAKRLGVPTKVVGKTGMADQEAFMALLNHYSVDFIALAGFLLMMPKYLSDSYKGRMVNIHPALLPKYGGKGMYGHHVHEAVKANGERETGITIHYVSEICDGGTIIFQASVPISQDDSPDQIAQKVHDLEMEHYPKVIDKVLDSLI